MFLLLRVANYSRQEGTRDWQSPGHSSCPPGQRVGYENERGQTLQNRSCSLSGGFSCRVASTVRPLYSCRCETPFNKNKIDPQSSQESGPTSCPQATGALKSNCPFISAKTHFVLSLSSGCKPNWQPDGNSVFDILTVSL